LLPVVALVLAERLGRAIFQERFYIFSPARLRELQLQTLQKHGNNTRAVIDEIVSTLRAEQPEWAISKKEEWVRGQPRR
jgi:hypothetical protein